MENIYNKKFYIIDSMITDNPIEAFDLKNNEKIAIIGAGGKTTTLNNIAKSYSENNIGCICMTTTNMEYVKTEKNIEKIKNKLIKAKNVFVGNKIVKNGTLKIKEPDLDIKEYVLNQNKFPVIIEADGAKRCPIKVQRDYEPALPENLNKVILVVGIDALFGRIDKVSARPQDMCKFLEKSNNEYIDIDDFVKIIISEKGLYKDLEDKEVILLINKVDTEAKMTYAKEIRDKIAKERNIKIVISKSI